ncbi:MAG: ADP-ribosylglycohydrolase family protein [Pseudomonadota bacterium]
MAVTEKLKTALFGAYVADAASLGLHWLYDPDRIDALEGPVAFRPPDPADFEGAKGVFVHPGKQAGDLSHYGAQMRVMVRALAGGSYEQATYQSATTAAFGPGGWWHGYIDKATRGTLEGIASGRVPSGADDDQIPALSKLPPLVAIGGSDAEIDDAVSVTNANGTAADSARAAAASLRAAFAGATIVEALEAGIAAAGPERSKVLASSLQRAQEDAVAYGGELGRACPLPQSLPVSFQILAGATGFKDAVETNIRVAGDNCGRAIFVGAMAAAVHGVPLDWALEVRDGQALWAELGALKSVA